MSLDIEAKSVTRVLLLDGWHDVAGGSFLIERYEIHTPRSDGRSRWTWKPAEHADSYGFQFATSDGRTISGPMLSLRAVETRED